MREGGPSATAWERAPCRPAQTTLPATAAGCQSHGTAGLPLKQSGVAPAHGHLKVPLYPAHGRAQRAGRRVAEALARPQDGAAPAHAQAAAEGKSGGDGGGQMSQTSPQPAHTAEYWVLGTACQEANGHHSAGRTALTGLPPGRTALPQRARPSQPLVRCRGQPCTQRSRSAPDRLAHALAVRDHKVAVLELQGQPRPPQGSESGAPGRSAAWRRLPRVHASRQIARLPARSAPATEGWPASWLAPHGSASQVHACARSAQPFPAPAPSTPPALCAGTRL